MQSIWDDYEEYGAGDKIKNTTSKEDLRESESAFAMLLREPALLGEASRRRRRRSSSWNEAWVQATTASTSALAAKNNKRYAGYALRRYSIPGTHVSLFFSVVRKANPFFIFYHPQTPYSTYCSSTRMKAGVSIVFPGLFSIISHVNFYVVNHLLVAEL